jgi:hypothetical protein
MPSAYTVSGCHGTTRSNECHAAVHVNCVRIQEIQAGGPQLPQQLIDGPWFRDFPGAVKEAKVTFADPSVCNQAGHEHAAISMHRLRKRGHDSVDVIEEVEHPHAQDCPEAARVEWQIAQITLKQDYLLWHVSRGTAQAIPSGMQHPERLVHQDKRPIGRCIYIRREYERAAPGIQQRPARRAHGAFRECGVGCGRAIPEQTVIEPASNHAVVSGRASIVLLTGGIDRKDGVDMLACWTQHAAVDQTSN